VIDNPNFSYTEKLEKVKKLIVNFTKDVIIYTKLTESVLNNLSDISYECGKDETGGLYVDGCTLAVPKTNLVSKKDNATLYSYRVADEIVRYGRIQNFVLNSNQFLNIGNAEYKINPDEYIITESILSTADYWEDMVDKNTNEYRTFNEINGIPYDMAKTKLYLPRMVELQKTVVEKEVGCSTVEKFRDQTKQKYWGNNVFPANTMQIVFKDTVECSFEPLIYIMKQINNEIYGVQELRKMIYDAYSEYIGKHREKIIYILSKQGKRALFKSKVDFETIVKSDAYFMTTLDLWVFAQKYNVPIILFSSKNVLHDVLIIQGDGLEKDYLADRGSITNTESENSWIILGGETAETKFFFFKSVSEIRIANKISSHVLIQKPFFRSELNDLNQRIKDTFDQEKVFSFDQYLDARP